ncbi:Carbonyl reductase family member 4 [Pseudocercospora fuligena]|uniref:Carbonyl reductase family member 4 n=1 Tax=Pseudocercospora fuligena TaxID=685502 RepID=A0A8H6VB35_9PEZI|nr:Carbonyl reductase family member 4 [Pseudocercospora fuligena]
MSSVAGTNVSHVGDNGTIMYSASKAAAHHLGRNLAVELGPRNITVNTVAPGFFPSKLASGLIEILGGEEELSRENPRRRLGEPSDIAGVMLFLWLESIKLCQWRVHLSRWWGKTRLWPHDKAVEQ